MTTKNTDKARIVIDIEDLREVTAQTEESKKDGAQPKAVNGAATSRGTVKSTVMCPW